MDEFYCATSPISLAHFLNFSFAPTLLFYAYVPAVLFSLFISLTVLYKSNFSLQSKLLLGIAASFSLWVLNIFFQWIAVYASVVYFSAQLTVLFEILIFIFSIYFLYVFLNKRDIHFTLKYIFLFVLLVVAILLPTRFNVNSFDIVNCEAILGSKWNFVYGFEIFSIIWTILFCVSKYFNKTTDKITKKQIPYIATSVALFLGIFTASNIFGEITGVYEINLFGPIGLVLFISVLAYLIVRFQAFNVKLFSAQTLVWGLVFLIGAQFFFIKNPVNYFLNGFTFIATIIFGNYLIKSVKREIEQKEYLATLNRELKDLIKQRENLVHLITHKVKGSFTRSKYIFAEMVEGSFGKLDDMMAKMAKKGLDSDNEGIHTVDMVLNAFNLGSGIVKYEMKPMDLKKTVEEVLNEKGSRVKDKGLGVELIATDSEYKVNGDTFWLKEVVNNFVENSIRYSVKGSIHIKLEKLGNKVRLAVKDEGVGLTDDDKKGLFTEGGRGKDSLKMNVDSTGYGLFSVKVIVEAHGGRVWAESEGRDKGSTFYVELPAIA